MTKILFVDFDGVLHPWCVRFNQNLQLTLETEDQNLYLFCWSPILQKILNEVDPDEQIKIVLSTSWAHRYGWQNAAKNLPIALQCRVIGGTVGYNRARGLQILKYVQDFDLKSNDWLALDDNDYEWPNHVIDRLVGTNENLGLSDKSTQNLLRNKLKKLLAE